MNDYLEELENIPCPVEKTVKLIGSKWSILIIRDLNIGKKPIRFNELLKKLKPISSRTLSLKLKELTKYEVVKKNIVSFTPPAVEYSLTEKGEDLSKVIRSMAEWSLKWHNKKKVFAP